jgi:hypothetical protein
VWTLRARGPLEDTDDIRFGLQFLSYVEVGFPMSVPQTPGRRSDGEKVRMPTRTRWLIAVGVVVVVIVTSALGLFYALIALLGLAGLTLGVVAVATGAAPLARLRSRKAGAVAIAFSLLLIPVGAGLNALGQQPASNPANLVANPTASPTAPPKATAASKTTATPKATTKPTATASPKPTATPTPTPVATEGEVQEASAIPFAAVSVDDSSIDVGASAIAVAGANGEKVTTYLVQYVDGVEVSRAVAREEVTVAAVDEVTAIGSRVPEPEVAPEPAPEVPVAAFYQNCDAVRAAGAAPLYTDDPGYSRKLDRDGDGVACES